ncbi:uncharacterized protein N7484_002077 [Penicillium longicatenatum]|uniref:uncharacterized protein n=1 Tax=Penicillium longicatenatum TaxID=1561947 RepID=UPI0025492C27|nr:uncharacterized protein N7484_002077 [Penicillium longicatenatum]KAJ5658428.1 hypothetical protein N7484_002077 [Penicillium longicatenatum]
MQNTVKRTNTVDRLRWTKVVTAGSSDKALERFARRKKANKNESRKASIKTHTHTNTDKIADEEAQHEKEKKDARRGRGVKGAAMFSGG